MPAQPLYPTPDTEVNHLLADLLASVQAILGERFVGMYLTGSLASGDFDRSSDVDFVVVTARELDGEDFARLQAVHDRLAARGTHWATELEGAYIAREALRRYEPGEKPYPHSQRGSSALIWTQPDSSEVINRHILRERGIALAGPPPQTLIDPIAPDDLRRAMVALLPAWTTPLLQNPARLQPRGYQSFLVLSMCRALYTLEFGRVVSKRAAAEWARARLGEPWSTLIDRAWAGRDNPGVEAPAEDVQGTLDLMRHTLALSQKYKPGTGAA